MGNSVSCCIPVSNGTTTGGPGQGHPPNSGGGGGNKTRSSKHSSSGLGVFQFDSQNRKGSLSVFHSREQVLPSVSIDSIDGGGKGGSIPLGRDVLRLRNGQSKKDGVLRMHSESSSNIQHISEREPEDGINDPSINPKRGPIFMVRSKSELREGRERKQQRRSQYALGVEMQNKDGASAGGGTPSDRETPSSSGPLTRKFNSCSTIYVDDSTVSQPNLRNTMKCVSLAIFYHIKNRENQQIRTLDIFDERLHPLSKEELCVDFESVDPEHRQVYKFLRTLFHSAQLTAECAIVTLVYLERLLTYGEMDIGPSNWKRMVLGAVLLASKVWDDQAVWNVDYCQILRDIKVEDMNELERSFLELLQFNINVPASVYAKYYFDLRSLADANDLSFPAEQLSVERAQKLEALSRSCAQKVSDGVIFTNALKRSNSLDNMAKHHRRSVAILS